MGNWRGIGGWGWSNENFDRIEAQVWLRRRASLRLEPVMVKSGNQARTKN